MVNKILPCHPLRFLRDFCAPLVSLGLYNSGLSGTWVILADDTDVTVKITPTATDSV